MAEFISREATIKRIKEVYCVGCNSYHGVRCRACGTGDAIDIIEDAPVAERRMIMAEYHVGCGAFGIYAGTLNSRNKNLWQNKTECTDEALCAVRDYLVQECLGGLHGSKSSGGYEWTLKDGRVVKLLVVIENGGDSDEAD